MNLTATAIAKGREIRWADVRSWPTGQRVCRTCGKLRPDDEFHKFKRGAHGRYPHCKECRKPETKKQHRATPIEVRLFRAAKARAKRLDVPFDLELYDIVVPKLCPVLKVPLKYKTAYAPSLDRKNPVLGYVKGNVQVLSKRANMLKNNGILEEFKLLVDFLGV